MWIIKQLLKWLFLETCRVLLPKKYYNHYFIEDFFKSWKPKDIRIIKALWLFSNGFLPEEYFAYNLSNDNKNKYISARQYCNLYRINGDYTILLANKLLFETYLKEQINGIEGLNIVESIGFINKYGAIVSLKKEVFDGTFKNIHELISKKELIFKPVLGNSGIGIYLLHRNESGIFINGKVILYDELLIFLMKLRNYLIQEKFNQVGHLHEISPNSLNTLRIVTMFDPKTNKPFIPFVVHRFGSKHSDYKDSYSQGGISAWVDIDAGIITNGKVIENGEIKTYNYHPVTLQPISGTKIPNWEKIKKAMLELAERNPFWKYVGWDVIVSDEKAFILEGNHGPGLDIIQIHKPIKEIPQAWEFYEYHKFLKTDSGNKKMH